MTSLRRIAVSLPRLLCQQILGTFGLKNTVIGGVSLPFFASSHFRSRNEVLVRMWTFLVHLLNVLIGLLEGVLLLLLIMAVHMITIHNKQRNFFLSKYLSNSVFEHQHILMIYIHIVARAQYVTVVHS